MRVVFLLLMVVKRRKGMGVRGVGYFVTAFVVLAVVGSWFPVAAQLHSGSIYEKMLDR